MPGRQEFTDHVPKMGVRPSPPPTSTVKPISPIGAARQVQADVVHRCHCAVTVGGIDRDLELARQVGGIRVESRPLAQDLGPRPRIGDLVGGDAGESVSDVTLRMQLPEVWMACISTSANSARISGTSASCIQLNCRFWRV